MTEFLPSEFYLAQNYPNPFRRKTVIKYCIAHKRRVRLTVYNSKGELLKTLIDEEKKPGTYEIEFDTVETHLQNGTYSYRLEATPIGGQVVDYQSEKTMLIQK